ncbi:DUF3408 domain-containing protein [Parabacteroides sp. AF17-28]|uniref:DUF3408 domain-containing protein n=1 Tax=Parabacteroides sp. AF17-28 TaxID=2292241 RepID=UPI000EFFC382|nr:DUF3408 domain-containing protein [Parabacteroides sp. AF17-28]RHR59538.1 DUF3408 domain-containing protein [Parabacteroides sp. AF17-28]
MSKKFKNIENDEAFKNFKLEDYMPSMPEHKSEEVSSAVEQEPVEEAGSLFPVLDEPDTSAVLVAVSDTRIHEQVTEAKSDDKAQETVTDTGNIPVERTIARRISSKQRRLSLDEYRATYLRVPKIADRKPVFVSGEVRDRLDEIVRRLGGRGMSASGLIENLARLHIEAYREDIEQWRKL